MAAIALEILTALALYVLVIGPLVVHAVWCACLKAGCPPWRRDWWTS